jgi:tricarballylate dehydrogenase
LVLEDRGSGCGEKRGRNRRVTPSPYAAGELLGGIFYFNYPGGSGLTKGAVFGKMAGASPPK